MTKLSTAGTSPAKDFQELQTRLAKVFESFSTLDASRTVLIVPSLSMDQEVLSGISGAHHYEERMLCYLMLLRMPRTRVIYVSSYPIPESIIDYYLHLLPGIPAQHARSRLTLFSCHDGSPISLTEKVLARPRLIERIRASIADQDFAYMICFNVTAQERSLAMRLNLPIYGCDPDLLHWGSKSGSRKIFREAGIDMPEGFEDVRSAGEIVDALAELKARRPNIKRAVVKLDEGFSGEGNAVFSYESAPEGPALTAWIESRLPDLAFEAKDMTWELFSEKLSSMGGIVEEFIEGDVKRSPSAQFRVDPLGRLEPISTHDQVLGGESGQVFLGCVFPADETYRLQIQESGRKAAHALAAKGVLGRFAIDFLSVKEGSEWRHYAIEINLRRGGTTHPFIMLEFLTEGQYDSATGTFVTPSGQSRCYYASDNVESEAYRGLLPADLIDIAALNCLHFDGASQQGVMFHLIGALSEFGKLGVLCIAPTHEKAEAYYRLTTEVLDRECRTV
ncbi:peptide ligase PGM1-related protein [Microvirga guangxiensis]|uniref:peptide ligase PGM1-related protein n=1 Tax=Microvirga guangxiensis TaxID=549386 RepID=UPI000B83BC65|nr:peptide ligase PGM1-related protein [Microvirga guangxiensis]